MKNILVILLAVVMCISFCACGEPTTYNKIGDTVSTERVAFTLKDAKATIAVNNSGSWTSSTGYATNNYFTPVEYKSGNPFAAKKGNTLIWAEFYVENNDRDVIYINDTFREENVSFQIKYNGKKLKSDEIKIGVESLDGENWKKCETRNTLIHAGENTYCRIYIEVPEEISDTDTFNFIVKLPNTEGKFDKFSYNING